MEALFLKLQYKLLVIRVLVKYGFIPASNGILVLLNLMQNFHK
jgi:hypothetical protein